ncbi:hypothetical protein GDO81_007723 [Engystomops pustulosus]|uniref:Uncharacterized protein n=1 Tax=Engystomops pustulosus TaxID=76066 RepID=A0AAV7C9E5_ENGPU|nr:hypothetical protein GDO81_007723 [Engystomops pustulosus]
MVQQKSIKSVLGYFQTEVFSSTFGICKRKADVDPTEKSKTFNISISSVLMIYCPPCFDFKKEMQNTDQMLCETGFKPVWVQTFIIIICISHTYESVLNWCFINI